MNRSRWNVLAVILGLFLLCTITSLFGRVFLLNWFRPNIPTQLPPLTALETADVFMTVMRVENYDQVLFMCSPELRDILVSSQGLRSLVENNQVEPQQWDWLENIENSSNQQVYLEGTVRFKNERKGVVNLELQNINEIWVIYYLNLQVDWDAP